MVRGGKVSAARKAMAAAARRSTARRSAARRSAARRSVARGLSQAARVKSKPKSKSKPKPKRLSGGAEDFNAFLAHAASASWRARANAALLVDEANEHHTERHLKATIHRAVNSHTLPKLFSILHAMSTDNMHVFMRILTSNDMTPVFEDDECTMGLKALLMGPKTTVAAILDHARTCGIRLRDGKDLRLGAADSIYDAIGLDMDLPMPDERRDPAKILQELRARMSGGQLTAGTKLSIYDAVGADFDAPTRMTRNPVEIYRELRRRVHAAQCPAGTVCPAYATTLTDPAVSELSPTRALSIYRTLQRRVDASRR